MVDKRKAIALISGGLDSLLATKLVLEQGAQVEAVNFFTGFSGDHDYHYKKFHNGAHGARWVADQLGIKLHIVDIFEKFKPVLLKPKYGYGANLNPCLDCKLFMIVQAQIWAKEHGFDFLITGEVLGQRPKSQRKDTLPIASKITSNLIVRPLSAKLLPITLPEQEGWIDRDKLCNFSGRGRGPQIELAKKFGFTEFPQPGGGCVLTDPNYCKRLQDLWDNKPDKNYSLDEILLLKTGRHLRINSDLKLIVGRDEIENNFLETFADRYTLLQTMDYPGAVILVDGDFQVEQYSFLAGIAAYFSKGRHSRNVKVLSRDPQKSERIIEVTSIASPKLIVCQNV